MATTAPIILPIKTPGLNNLQKLERRMKALEDTVEQLNVDLAKSNKQLEALKKRSAPAAQGMQKLAVAAAKAAAAYFTIQKAAELAGNAIREAVARDTAQQQLSILAKQFGEVEASLLLAQRASQKFGLGLTETTGQITQVYARLRPLGASLEEIETVFNGFNTAARLGGSTAAEASGAFLQLSQALGSGYLRGQEFNSVAEQAPMVLQAIAKETGLAVGQLKEFAAEGGITSDVVLRALKRIEQEGASQLEEALNTPQQAFKDLQNAAEDLNVEVGRIVQPLVISFVKELTGLMKETTKQMQTAGKAAEYLGTMLEPLVELGGLIAKAFEAMDISFGDFVGQIYRSLPGLGQLIRAYETLANLTGSLAQQQDNSKGGRNFGANYKAQEQALFSAAGGYSPYSSGGGLSGGNSLGMGGGPSSKELEKQRERLEQQFAAGEQIRQGLQREMQLLATVDTLEKARLENAFALEDTIARINETAAPAQREELIALAEKNALYKDTQLVIDDLASSYKDLSGVTEELTPMLSFANELGEEYKQLADTIASSLTSAFRSVIDGSMTAQEALASVFQNIADAFIDMALQMIQQYLYMQIIGLIGSFFGGGSMAGPGGYTINAGAVPKTSGISFFEGGGFTGRGPRTGGVDGRGGFPAILHPNETVIDHTRRGGGTVGGDTVVNITINETGNGQRSSSGSNTDDAQQLARLIENATLSVINREKRPGGSLSR